MRSLLVPIVFLLALGCRDGNAPLATSPLNPSGLQGAAAEGGYVAVDLGTLGGERSVATGINDHAVVIGTSKRADGQSVAFKWSSSEGMTLLGLFTGLCHGAMDINNSNAIAGWYITRPSSSCALLGYDGSGPVRGFMVDRKGRVRRFLNVPEGTDAPAVAINNHGDVIGWEGFPAGGFVWGFDGSEWRIRCGGSMALWDVTDDLVVVGGGTGVPHTYWGGVRWKPGDGLCPRSSGETFLTTMIAGENADGIQIGRGAEFIPDPNDPEGGTFPGTGQVGFRFEPSSGYSVIDLDPVAISNRGHIVGTRDGLAIIIAPNGAERVLGVGAPMAVNNFGDVVGTNGAGHAALWTRRPLTLPHGHRSLDVSQSAISGIRERAAGSACRGKFALLAAMDAFPECRMLDPSSARQ